MSTPGYEVNRFGMLNRPGLSRGFWINSMDEALQTGPHTIPFEDGTIQEKRYFIMGRENGWRKTLWPGGGLRQKTFFKNGSAHGVSKSWHFNGQIATRATFVKDKIVGEVERWSTKGEPQANLDGGRDTRARTKAVGEKDQELLAQKNGPDGHYYDKSSERPAEGWYVKRFDDGTIESEVNFVAGKESGCTRRYWLDGRLRAEGHVIDGLGQGLFRTWHCNGQLARRYLMETGNFVGLYETWSAKGRKTWEQPWENGDQHGYEKGWDEDGNLTYMNYYYRGINLAELYGFERED